MEPEETDLADLPFFPVSPLKLAILSVCTVGLYELFWFYIHWTQVKYREETRIKPAWRALFAIVFCLPLFWKIRSFAKAQGIRIGPLPEISWLLFVCLTGFAAFVESDYNELWLVGFLTFVPLIPIQIVVNRVHESLGFRTRFSFTNANYVAVIVGAPFTLVVVLATFLIK